MEYRFGLRQRLVDRGVDTVAGALDFTLAALHLAVIDTHFHKGRCCYLGPMGPERDLIIPVAAARDHQGQMVEDALAEPLHEGQPVRGSQIDTRLPFIGAVVSERLRRNPVVHERPPALPLDGDFGWFFK
jgi:hypothetical protein